MKNKRLWTGLFCLLTAFLSLSCSSRPRNYIILCAGDSLTERGYPAHLKKLLSREGIRARVLNYGRSGNTSGEYLQFIKKERARLEAERPDFILLQLGTNDVRLDGDHTTTEAFEGHMRNIIGVFSGFETRRGKRPAILLATVPPIPEATAFPFSPESAIRVREEINPVVRRLGLEFRLTLVDNFSLFQGAPQLLADVHPTEEGTRRLAASWYAGLRPLLQ